MDVRGQEGIGEYAGGLCAGVDSLRPVFVLELMENKGKGVFASSLLLRTEEV